MLAPFYSTLRPTEAAMHTHLASLSHLAATVRLQSQTICWYGRWGRVAKMSRLQECDGEAC
jgi:hypothetical protein